MAATMPAWVSMGVVKEEGREAQLHRHTVEKNVHKMEKLLKKGVEVDCVNHLGQTPLFCAALLGSTSSVELLLQYGADPNHRCGDRSTPVHAAMFSCKTRLLSTVLDAGGDLRLHDHRGFTPQDWVKAAAQEQSPKMVAFLKSCASDMHSASQPRQFWNLHRSPGPSVPTLRSCSLLEFLMHGGNRSTSVCDTVRSYGFGKLCIDKTRQLLGLLACLPTIEDSELCQVEDEPMLSYTCGGFTRMTNKSWRGCRVTVKEMQSRSALEHDSNYLDLLIIEQQFCSQLFHPHLLQLLAVCVSEDLLQIRLVFERVHIGSLYSLLHHRHEELLVLGEGALLPMVLQVCEALLFLHDRGLVLRGLSSHSVQIVHPRVAKVTGLGFMVPRSSKGDGPADHVHLPLPLALYNWAAPEAISQSACTGKADLYSLCALIQELYTGCVPWGQVDPLQIREAVVLGQALEADPRVPLPYYELVRSSLQPRPQDRTSSLQDLHYMLRSNIKEQSQGRERGSGLHPDAGGYKAAGWSPDSTLSREQQHTGRGPMAGREAEGEQHGSGRPGREIGDQLDHLEQLLWKVILWKTWWCGGDPGWQDEVPAGSAPSSMRAETSREERCLSLSPHTDPDSTRTFGSDASGTQEESGAEGNWSVLRREVPSREPEPLGAAALDLTVSQALLQQSENSLRAVEMAGQGCRPGYHAARGERLHSGSGVDEVDSGKRERGGEGASSATSAWGLTRATGPPSAQYPPVSQGPLYFSPGTHREREKEGVFHIVNQTLITTGKGQEEEESFFESDYSQSPAEPSITFFTPSLQLQPHATWRHSLMPASEEHLQLTVEACQPAMSTAGAAMDVMPGGSHSVDEVYCRLPEMSGASSPLSGALGLTSTRTSVSGPHAHHYPPPRGIHTVDRTRHDSPLTAGGPWSLGEEAYGEQREDPSSEGEEQSLYTSAQEESFVDPRARLAQTSRISVPSGMTERRGQKPSTEQQSVNKQWDDESTYALFAASDPQDHDNTSLLQGRSDHPNARWSTVRSHMQPLPDLDPFFWNSSTPQSFSIETFTTTSLTEPSVSSILLFPVMSPEEEDTLTAASSGQRQSAGTQRGTRPGGRSQAGRGADDPEGHTRAAPLWTSPAEDSGSEQSDPGSGDSGCADPFSSATAPDKSARAPERRCLLQGKGGIQLDRKKEEVEEDDITMSEEEKMPPKEETSDETVSWKGCSGKAVGLASNLEPGPAKLCITTSGGEIKEMKLSATHLDLLAEADRRQGHKGIDAGDSKSSASELASQTEDAGAGPQELE